MGISVVRYLGNDSDRPLWGVLREGDVYELAVDAADHRELLQLHRSDSALIKASTGSVLGSMEDLVILSPISGAIQLFCQGLNYADHRAEGGMDRGGEAEENLIFTKAASSICGPYDDIVRPPGCELLDYEIELGLVLHKDIAGPIEVNNASLPDYIGALIIANDVSARDLSFGAPAMQWYVGKSQRTFCPLGPVLYLLAPEDFALLDALELELRMNGEIKQQATTDLLIHKPAKTLGDISQFADLNAGDCVLTGTPGGVQIQMNTKTGLSILMNMRNDKKRRRKLVAAQLANNPYLQPGDLLELRICSANGQIDLGVQRNRIVDA